MAEFRKMKNTPYLVDGSKRELLPGVLSMLPKEKPTDCFGISQKKCKTYSGKRESDIILMLL
jgi:hypothetical protein